MDKVIEGIVRVRGRDVKVTITLTKIKDQFMVFGQIEGQRTVLIQARQWQPGDDRLGWLAISVQKLSDFQEFLK